TGPERLKDRYRSTVDVDSGMLIVTAPEGIHEEIAELKRQLDVPEAGGTGGHVRFYKLMNTTASRVLATIQALEGGEGLDALMSATGGPPGVDPERFTGPNVPPPSLGQQLPKPPAYRPSQPLTTRPAGQAPSGPMTARTGNALVTVDPNTNTLIVVAPPEVQRIYEQLIRMLDKRRPQVMIEATLVTLDTSEDFSLGIDLLHSGSHGDHDYLFFSSFGLSTVDPVTGSLALEPGIGLNAALIGPSELSAVIRALAISGKSKVLSAPRVLVNDNATATLTSISEAPFTSINASDTVSTTSFAGYASAGSTLTVTPRISEGDHLQLQYSVTLNSFTGEGGDGVPPPRQTNNLTSEVTVPDGYAVIVGGLKRRDQSDTASKIPFLGDIPVLGRLFSLTDQGDTESTLFVFIRPVILRDDRFEDLKYLSRRDLELAELPPDLPASEPLLMY
ncbi:MAG: type II secretion system protein GspD, partial [Planctomycetota bacterium]